MNVNQIKILGLLAVFVLSLAATAPAASAERRVLVYTKNQTGKGLYVHDNLKASAEAIQKLGRENGFPVEVSADPSLFSRAGLAKYKVIVFDNTNNEIFENEAQKEALQDFVHRGGGVVGIHSATGSMRNWPWFWSLIGGKFKRHAKMQTFTVKVQDAGDISTKSLPATFEWTDEFYYVEHMPEGLHFLLMGDLKNLNDPGKDTYPGRQFGDEYPLSWRHEFEGGRSWYTALGHQPEHYTDPRLTQHLLGGLLWAMGADAAAPPAAK